jgi:hypothetical protein
VVPLTLQPVFWPTRSVRRQVLAALMNNTFFGDGQAKGGLGEMPSASRRDTVPCMHSGESGKCGQPVL